MFLSMSATVLIVTDVFGNTPAIASLQRSLGQSCIVVSPFDDGYSAKNEQDAYQAFLAAGGVHTYAKKLQAIVQEQKQIRHVIGFSAGASAWWLSNNSHLNDLHSTTLFYGSRIRDHLDIQSHHPTHFIFAEHENAYQAQQVVKALRQRGYDAELAIGCKHGFMNPYSSGFSLKTQTHYLEVLARKIAQKHEPAKPLAFGT
jgi:dienelactone hydrolase